MTYYGIKAWRLLVIKKFKEFKISSPKTPQGLTPPSKPLGRFF